MTYLLNGKRRSRALPADEDMAALTERVNALKQKSDAEDERNRMLDLGADPVSADLHARAVFALRQRGTVDPNPDQYVQAVEDERRADEPDPPEKTRPDYEAIHTAAVKLLANRGIEKPNYEQLADAYFEVSP